VRQPIPDDLWNAAADLSRRYPTSLLGRVLKLDSNRLEKLVIKRSVRTSSRKKPQAAFFQLPIDTALPEVKSTLPQSPIGCRLQIERPDGSRLTLTLNILLAYEPVESNSTKRSPSGLVFRTVRDGLPSHGPSVIQ
jgi:hypothetical protein